MRSPNPQAELTQLKDDLQGLRADLKAAYRLMGGESPPPDAPLRVTDTLRQAIRHINAMLAPKWPEPTTDEPDLETLEDWMVDDGGCEATDGCWVEPDGRCPHGHPSWFVKLGLI